MSRYVDLMSRTQRLLVTAGEEASRFGLPDADIDHLFLAVLLSDSTAGEALRRSGITLDTARDAVARYHTCQLQSLGLTTSLPEHDSVAKSPQPQGSNWTHRTQIVLNSVKLKDSDELEAQVLRNLLNEPSGVIAGILESLEVTPARIDAELATLTAPPAHNSAHSADSPEAAEHFYIPAAPDPVMRFLLDPNNMKFWGPQYAVVEFHGDPHNPLPGDTWTGHTSEVPEWEHRTLPAATDGRAPSVISPRPDRAPTRTRHVSEQIELLERRNDRIAWRFTSLDKPRTNARRVEVALKPSEEGTRLKATLLWDTEANQEQQSALGLRLKALALRPMRPILRRLQRQAVAAQLSNIGNSISRVFR